MINVKYGIFKEWNIYWSNQFNTLIKIPKSYENSSDTAVPNHTGIGHLGWAALAQGRVKQFLIISTFVYQILLIQMEMADNFNSSQP